MTTIHDTPQSLPPGFTSEWDSFLSSEWTGSEKQLLLCAGNILRDEYLNGRCSEYQLLHPLGVARILADEMSLGATLSVAALLHDIYRPESSVAARIRIECGKEVAVILESYFRISGFDVHKHTFESENFRKLLFNLAGDIRVLLIKLGDRLYHVRHLDSLNKDSHERFTLEAKHLYAGIAHRLGLYKIKNELEDLSLKFLEPEVYTDIERKLEETQDDRETFIADFVAPVREALTLMGVGFEIKGRSKSVTSILAKMRNQKVEFEEVMDVFAVRIILDSERETETGDCWKAYSLVTDLYTPNPKRMRDWISKPRANGYESLHVTVLGPSNRWVEVQIRSKRMDMDAEMGNAAHWKYKGGEENQMAESWIKRFRELLDKPWETLDVSQTQIAGMYAEDIFVFTPKGDIRRLKAGSTVLDLAFEIHTDIGSRCTGARLNGKRVPMRYVLGNADMVEIATAKSQVPKRDWLDYTITSKARNKIKRILKENEYKQADIGKEILKKKLEQWKISFNDLNIKKLLHNFGLRDVLQLYQEIAEDRIDPADIKRLLTDIGAESRGSGSDKAKEVISKQLPREAQVQLLHGSLLIDENPAISSYQMATCCTPKLGNEVFAFVTVAKGISIHRFNCPNAPQMRLRYPYRVLTARWVGSKEPDQFQCSLQVVAKDSIGLLNQLTDLISNEMKINLLSLSITTGNGRVEGNFDVEINDEHQLDSLVRMLLKIKGVETVTRIN